MFAAIPAPMDTEDTEVLTMPILAARFALMAESATRAVVCDPPFYAGDVENFTHIQCAQIKVILKCRRGRNLISTVLELTKLPCANLVRITTGNKEKTIHRQQETRSERVD